MYDAFAGTLTNQVAGLAGAEVAVNGVVPTVTVTVTPPSDPVSPEIANPVAFSSMFTLSSPAMTLRFSSSAAPTATVIVPVAVAP